MVMIVTQNSFLLILQAELGDFKVMGYYITFYGLGLGEGDFETV